MRLTGIRVGDIVRADWNGQRYYALVADESLDAAGRRVIEVESLNGRMLPARLLTARQVVGHWRRAKA